MLFDVACSEIKELLRSAPKVWQLACEGLVVLYQGDQRHKSGGLLNGKLIVHGLRTGVEHFFRRVLRSDVPAQQNTLSTDVLPEGLDVSLFKLALFKVSDPLSGGG